MPSRAERVRAAAEWGLRVASVLLLAWMLWIVLRPVTAETRTERAAAAELPAVLPRWTLDPPARIHLSLDTVPDERARDWLVALRRAGAPIGWSDGGVPSLAVATERVAEPEGGIRVLVSAPESALVRLRDSLGSLDSGRVAAGGLLMEVPRVHGSAVVAVGVHHAHALRAGSAPLGRVLVLGRATWEARFVAAALQERGWEVDARQLVAPGLESISGERVRLDTGRYAAVVAIDSSAEREGRGIAAFVRSGGGLILAGNAARAPTLAALAPARLGAALRPPGAAFAVSDPRRALSLRPLIASRPDAVVLERRDGAVAAAARRERLGRVVQVGYEESWRWRLAGGNGSVAAHRAWWSRVVAGAAYRGRVTEPAPAAGDAAPRAALVESLGMPAAAPAAERASLAPTRLEAWMLALLLVLLLLEWGSRRLRGAR